MNLGSLYEERSEKQKKMVWLPLGPIKSQEGLHCTDVEYLWVLQLEISNRALACLLLFPQMTPPLSCLPRDASLSFPFEPLLRASICRTLSYQATWDPTFPSEKDGCRIPFPNSVFLFLRAHCKGFRCVPFYVCMCVPFCAWRPNGLVQEQVNSASIQARKDIKDPGQKTPVSPCREEGHFVSDLDKLSPCGVTERFFLGFSLSD